MTKIERETLEGLRGWFEAHDVERVDFAVGNLVGIEAKCAYMEIKIRYNHELTLDDIVKALERSGDDE